MASQNQKLIKNSECQEADGGMSTRVKNSILSVLSRQTILLYEFLRPLAVVCLVSYFRNARRSSDFSEGVSYNVVELVRSELFPDCNDIAILHIGRELFTQTSG
jgi:hypothetical protein